MVNHTVWLTVRSTCADGGRAQFNKCCWGWEMRRSAGKEQVESSTVRECDQSNQSMLTDVMSQQGTILFSSETQSSKTTIPIKNTAEMKWINETDLTMPKGYWTGHKSRGLYTWASRDARCPWLVPAASRSTRTCSTARSGGRKPLWRKNRKR